MDESGERHRAFTEAVDFYSAFFPQGVLESEIRSELVAAEGARLSDAVRDPSERALARDVRRVLGVRHRLPSLSPDEREYVVEKDTRRVRSALVASWLEILSSTCFSSPDFIRLDRSLLPTYAPDDGVDGEGSWHTGIVSRPSVYLLRKESVGRAFDAFVDKVRTALDEKGELPLFVFPKTIIKKSSSGYLVLFG